MDRKATVLVVEDSQPVLESIVALLGRDWAIEIRTAVNCAQAVAAVAAGGIDCVVLDLVLPDCGDATDCLRKLQVVRRHLAVVAITGYGSEMETQILDLGAEDYLQKPLVSKDLLHAVRHAIIRAARNARREQEIVANVEARCRSAWQSLDKTSAVLEELDTVELKARQMEAAEHAVAEAIP